MKLEFSGRSNAYSCAAGGPDFLADTSLTQCKPEKTPYRVHRKQTNTSNGDQPVSVLPRASVLSTFRGFHRVRHRRSLASTTGSVVQSIAVLYRGLPPAPAVHDTGGASRGPACTGRGCCGGWRATQRRRRRRLLSRRLPRARVAPRWGQTRAAAFEGTRGPVSGAVEGNVDRDGSIRKVMLVGLPLENGGGGGWCGWLVVSPTFRGGRLGGV